MSQTEGSVDVQQALVDLQPRLRRFARGLCGSLDDADELVQAAYERALTRLHLWQPGTRLDSWMFRIIQNLRFNQLRAAKVRQPADIEPEALGGPAVDASLHAGLMLEKVRLCMARLPDEQRAALVLVAVEGLSYKEAADVLELPVGTLTSRLGRARKALAEMLDAGTGQALRGAGGRRG